MKRRAIPAISLALVVLFSASFLLALPGAVSMPASAVTQAEIDALKESAGELEQQQKEIQAQLNAIAADKDEALEQKSLLEQQINVIQSEINNIDAQIAKYDELISQKEDELAQLEQQEAEQYQLFCERVRYMEEEGEVSYWAILFNAEDFSDMLDRFMMVEEIMAYDNAIMDELLATQAQIEQEKAELEEARTAQAHGPERTTFEHLHPELKRHRETTQLYALGLALAADCPPNDCRIYLNIFDGARELDAALDDLDADSVPALALRKALRERVGELAEMFDGNFAVKQYRKGGGAK